MRPGAACEGRNTTEQHHRTERRETEADASVSLELSVRFDDQYRSVVPVRGMSRSSSTTSARRSSRSGVIVSYIDSSRGVDPPSAPPSAARANPMRAVQNPAHSPVSAAWVAPTGAPLAPAFVIPPMMLPPNAAAPPSTDGTPISNETTRISPQTVMPLSSPGVQPRTPGAQPARNPPTSSASIADPARNHSMLSRMPAISEPYPRASQSADRSTVIASAHTAPAKTEPQWISVR